MNHPRRTRATRERGAAAVEFALVVPILLLLVLGIAEFGRAYNTSTTLSAAAREGARALALTPTSAGPAAARTAAQTTAAGLGLSGSQIVVSPAGGCPDPATSTATTTARVTITYPMTFVSHLFGSSVTLHGTGVMRCNG
jgi:Flp pilus assembly protein TadG